MKQAAYTVYSPPTLSLTHDRRNWNEIILIQKKKKKAKQTPNPMANVNLTCVLYWTKESK